MLRCPGPPQRGFGQLCAPLAAGAVLWLLLLHLLQAALSVSLSLSLSCPCPCPVLVLCPCHLSLVSFPCPQGALGSAGSVPSSMATPSSAPGCWCGVEIPAGNSWDEPLGCPCQQGVGHGLCWHFVTAECPSGEVTLLGLGIQGEFWAEIVDPEGMLFPRWGITNPCEVQGLSGVCSQSL